MRLVYKLIAGFMLITMLIWVVGYFAVQSSQKALQNAIKEGANAFDQHAVDSIDQAVSDKILVFQEYSADLTLKDALSRSNREFEKADSRARKADAGKSLSEEINEKLEFYKKKFGQDVFTGVTVMNKYGEAVAVAGGADWNDDRHEAEGWLQKAEQEGVYAAQPSEGGEGAGYLMRFAVRVDDRDGGFLGIIKAGLNLKEVLAPIPELNGSEDKRAYRLLSPDGRTIYSTGHFTRTDDPRDLLLGGGRPEKGFLSFITSNFWPEDVLISHALSRGRGAFKGFGWVLVAEHRTDDLYAPVVTLNSQILFISVIVTILAILTSLVISGSISDRIEKLRDATVELGKGNLDAHIDVNSKDELGQLASNFNQMAENLRASIISRDNEISERIRMEERVRHIAYHDNLTGLPNRLLFLDRLQQVITRGAWHKTMAAVLFLDLDRFKMINDTLGHAAGDELIKTVAARLEGSLRDGDTVARLGGDEFTVLLQDLARMEDIPLVIDKIVKALREPAVLKGQEVFINVSIGISVYPVHGNDTNVLLKNADTAMYHAKGKGGSTYQMYVPEMSNKSFERLRIETRLRSAIESGEFLLYYQPQVDSDTGRITGAEALVRWNDPESGIVQPSKFIPVAEDTGLIIPLSEWVLKTACLQAAKWRTSGTGVSVNISARVFGEDGFSRKVAEILKETGLPPGSLTLEITESTIMSDVIGAAAVMGELKTLGVRFAIDDFGTGYSSLSYLKHLPIDELKIDRTFLKDSEEGGDGLIVTAIIKLAQSLNLEPVAEGVETIEQLEFVRSQRCRKIQGYIFSKPVPFEEFTGLLKNTVYMVGGRLEANSRF